MTHESYDKIHMIRNLNGLGLQHFKVKIIFFAYCVAISQTFSWTCWLLFYSNLEIYLAKLLGKQTKSADNSVAIIEVARLPPIPKYNMWKWNITLSALGIINHMDTICVFLLSAKVNRNDRFFLPYCWYTTKLIYSALMRIYVKGKV